MLTPEHAPDTPVPLFRPSDQAMFETPPAMQQSQKPWLGTKTKPYRTEVLAVPKIRLTTRNLRPSLNLRERKHEMTDKRVPTLAHSLAPSHPGAASDFAEIEVRLGGRLGIAALDTDSGKRLSYRGDERFAMCSTFKWLWWQAC